MASGKRLVHRFVTGVGACVAVGVFGTGAAIAAPGGERARACDEVPTGVSSHDHWLHFKVPPGLMPDEQFDRRPAKLDVHRVRPVYRNGRCPWVPVRAIVLIHGRTVPGSVVFDLRDAATGGGSISVQERLARAGIDTFAPSLLGFGRSTGFDTGLDDPGNASLRPYPTDGSPCPHPEGCDRNHNPGVFSLDQQFTRLWTNPLDKQRRAHSSNERFASTDTWVRDIRQAIDDAIARAQPSDGKVVLLGYSAGAQRVGRTLYAANPVLPGSAGVIAKVSRVVFLSPLFGGTTEEVEPPGGFVTYPLHVHNAVSSAGGWSMPAGRDAACTGHVIPGSQEQSWAQNLREEPVGREWGGDDPLHPTGLVPSPTFSGYGWNAEVAGQLTVPSLVMQGFDDIGVPGGVASSTAIYDALPASMTNKLLVQVQCASHSMYAEGCAGSRCNPVSGTPYGGTRGVPWAGPHATVTTALTEWITRGTFDGAASGRFTVDASGVASASGP